MHYDLNKWEHQIREDIGKTTFEGLSTIFLGYFICEADNKREEYMKLILRKTFCSLSFIQNCCFLTQIGEEVDEVLIENFQQKFDFKNDLRIWNCQRGSIVPKVGIRSKRSEDYLALKNLFSQIYSLPDSKMKNFTLDFLDYGEDSCPTYKYFTFDEDNTYIGVADKGGEAVGFVCATTQHIDLEFLNQNFQLEAVYGLRKTSPEDAPELFLSEDSSQFIPEQSSIDTLESSSSLDNDVIHVLTDILDEVESKSEIIECLRDCFDEIFPKQETKFENREVSEIFDNNKNINISNPEYFSFIKHNSLPSKTIVDIVNSSAFDVKNDQHMELVTRLEEDVLKIEPERLKHILDSEAFDPSEEAYSKIALRVLDKMPYPKLNQFRKSSIGAKMYENIKLKRALSKQKSNIKLSFADMQVLLRPKANSPKNEPDNHSKPSDAQELNLNNIHYRNMGFISGLTGFKGTYRIRDNYSSSKENFQTGEKSEKHKNHESSTDNNEKYLIPSLEISSGIKIYVPKYHGDINCTFVEHLAIEEEYEHGSLSLIMAAFKYFPRVDYAILLLPYGTKKVPLLRQYFTKVPERPFSRYDKELFVFHKSGFNQEFKVRRYENNDFEGVKTLVRCSCLKDYLLNDLDICLKETDKHIDAVVLVSDDKIFGITVISEILELEFIRKNYDVGDRVNLRYHKPKSSGELLHCVIHPVALLLSGDFLKETMRLTRKSIIYHKIFPTRIVSYNPSFWQSICNILKNLIPLRLTERSPPKFEIQLREVENKEENSTSTYGLCYTSTKMILRDKPIISSRIVVIGCSDTAIGVLETLIYSQKYKFTNLTIISKTCIPGEFILNQKCYTFIPQKSDYTQSRLDSLCLPAWVTSVKGKVTLIGHDFLKIEDLEGNKKDSYQVGFDFLVICEDLEYKAEKVERSASKKDNLYRIKYSMLKNLWENKFFTVKTPCNIFSLNTAEDGAKVLNWLWKYFWSKGSSNATTSNNEMDKNTKMNRIVVYGSTLNAYVCVSLLLGENFPSTKITFVKSSLKEKLSSFYTQAVQEATDYVLHQSQLEMYEGNLEYPVDEDQVHFVNVTTQQNSFQLDRCALISFDKKNINNDMAKVLHASNLSFVLPTENTNGYPYLFINSNFQTNKPNIFAAGTATEIHTSNFKSIRLENCSYNSKEIGIEIGGNIIKAADENLKGNAVVLPILQRPSVTVANLPFGFTYILIMSPSREFRDRREPITTGKNAISPALMALGNLKEGSGIVPEIVPETEADGEKNLDETQKNDIGQENEESQEKTEIEHFNTDTTEQAEDLSVKIPRKRTFPSEPEYFAMEFDPSERIQRIEVLTKKAVVVETLMQLYDLQLEQLYTIFGIATSEGSDKVSFCLSGDWILPLDYFTLRNRGHVENVESNCGFEGFWRPGYPEYLMSRINTFLGSTMQKPFQNRLEKMSEYILQLEAVVNGYHHNDRRKNYFLSTETVEKRKLKISFKIVRHIALELGLVLLVRQMSDIFKSHYEMSSRRAVIYIRPKTLIDHKDADKGKKLSH
ncbi:hypothetical protein JTE90_001416 [Oedothorax gibbosus]|uniref:Cilia- and flagella-associated protein 61 N-terminal domain-containing protein n=1 Tax=Oedothorax gibbosus TaxID=931172 RepID=A0AAV6VFL1_9ARAC|nr:hypothetical protein JTE90_001416 [Oedothorax gibbosus]